MAVRDSLAEVPLFAELQGTDIDLIAQRVRQRRYRGGEAIFHRDDPGHALYIILSGRVKVHNETPDGSDVILAVLAEGEFFGDLSILDGEPRSADVSTLEPTEALVLTRDDLLDWDGPYRVEFDETAQRLEWRAVGTGGLTESLRLAASRVVDGADEANRDQRRRNDFAEDLREEDRERREESWQREGRLPPGEPY